MPVQDAGDGACADVRRGYELPAEACGPVVLLIGYGPRVECYDAWPAVTRGGHYARARHSRGGALMLESCAGKTVPGAHV